MATARSGPPASDPTRLRCTRVAAMFPPCAVDGPTLTVRKFTHRYTLDDLIAVGTLTVALADMLRDAVFARHNTSSLAGPEPGTPASQRSRADDSARGPDCVDPGFRPVRFPPFSAFI
jgi:hypothetical protein